MELKEEGCPGRQGDRRRLRLRRDLRVSLADGAAHGGMVGFGETYLPAFVLAVGLGEIMAGLIASVPLLAGGLMQLASPAGVRILGSHKRWVILCAGIQAVSFVPFLLAALGGRITGPTALLIAAIYWGTGLATGPAWNTWIGTVVPHAVRSRFFAFRTRASQAAVFGGFLAGGLGLQLAASAGHAIAAFAVMFALAGLCRFGSVVLLTLHSEPVPIPANMRRVSAREMWRLFQGDGGGKLLVYLVAVQAAVQLSSPFFTPFMFTKLHFSYGQYVFLLSVAYLTKILALPFFGRLARRFGAWRVLWIGGIGITPISAAWLVTQDFGWLAAVQVVSGVVWAAYELAFFLLFFESIRDEERTSVLTVYNFINSLAWVSGAVLGGALLVSTGAGFHGYLLLFGLSAVGRCLALMLLVGVQPTAQMPGARVLAQPAARSAAVGADAALPGAAAMAGLPAEVADVVAFISNRDSGAATSA